MGWAPSEYDDALWFLLSPITTIPLGIYAFTGFALNKYPYGEPDWRASARNTSVWAGISGSAWAWNAIVHPGKYPFVSGVSAYKVLGHTAASSAVIIPALATAAAIGWAATGETHGAVTPGVASGIGMPMTPELYSGTESDPTGYRRSLRDLFGW